MSLGRAAVAVVAAATTALASYVVGAAPPHVALAYARAAADNKGTLDGSRGRRKELLLAQVQHSDLSRTDREVSRALLSHYNHNRMDAWPGYARIAKVAHCTRRTAIKSVQRIKEAGFISIEHRWRLEDRWPGRESHDRTNVYRFADGAALVAPEEVDAAEAAEYLADAWRESRDEALWLSSSEVVPPPFVRERPNFQPPPRAASPAPAPGKPGKPAPVSPAAREDAARDGARWELFAAAFAAEHRAQYGAKGDRSNVKNPALKEQAVGVLWEYVSECRAWAAQRELEIAEIDLAKDLARRLSRAWIARPGRNNYVREKGHPIGLMVGDMARLGPEVVDAWKDAQRRGKAPAGGSGSERDGLAELKPGYSRRPDGVVVNEEGESSSLQGYGEVQAPFRPWMPSVDLDPETQARARAALEEKLARAALERAEPAPPSLTSAAWAKRDPAAAQSAARNMGPALARAMGIDVDALPDAPASAAPCVEGPPPSVPPPE
jgi:hypothetical protein